MRLTFFRKLPSIVSRQIIRDLEKVLRAIENDQELLIKKASVLGLTFFGEEDIEEEYISVDLRWLRLKDKRELKIEFYLYGTSLLGGTDGEISVIEEEKE